MFKFKSYNVKKASEKNDKEQPSSSKTTTTTTRTATARATATSATATGTLKKPSSKEKKKASPDEIKHVNNRQSPTYSQKIYPKKTVTEWHQNKTFSAKNETKKVVIPTPHKKLERK